MDSILIKTPGGGESWALFISAVLGKYLVPALRRWKAGQAIKEDGPTWHMSKQGTPTMGGLMFILGIGVAIVTAGWEEIQRGNLSISSCTSSLWCLEPLALWMTFKSCAITPTRG